MNTRIALVACGYAASSPARLPPAVPAAPELAIAELSFNEPSSDQVMFALGRDGALQEGGTTIGTLQRDGTFVFAGNAAVTARRGSSRRVFRGRFVGILLACR